MALSCTQNGVEAVFMYTCIQYLLYVRTCIDVLCGVRAVFPCIVWIYGVSVYTNYLLNNLFFFNYAYAKQSIIGYLNIF